MKRRSFLTMLGLAPVAATVPAVAAKEAAQSQIKIDTFVKEDGEIGAMLRSPSGDFELDLNNGRMTWYSDDDWYSENAPHDDEYEYEYDDWSH